MAEGILLILFTHPRPLQAWPDRHLVAEVEMGLQSKAGRRSLTTDTSWVRQADIGRFASVGGLSWEIRKKTTPHLPPWGIKRTTAAGRFEFRGKSSSYDMQD